MTTILLRVSAALLNLFSSFLFKHLGLELDSEADLVAAGVDLLALEQRRPRGRDAVLELVLVAHADLAGVVQLSLL